MVILRELKLYVLYFKTTPQKFSETRVIDIASKNYWFFKTHSKNTQACHIQGLLSYALLLNSILSLPSSRYIKIGKLSSLLPSYQEF